MNTTDQTKITKARNEQKQAIITLLQSEKLPIEDLPPSLDNFFVAVHNGKVIGAIGLEKYDHCGLLRSMVVNKEYRNKSTASQLVRELEGYAAELGIDCMYLLQKQHPGILREKVTKEYQEKKCRNLFKCLRSSATFARLVQL